MNDWLSKVRAWLADGDAQGTNGELVLGICLLLFAFVLGWMLGSTLT